MGCPPERDGHERPLFKKCLFPVQRVAKIVASRAATKKKVPFFWGGGGWGMEKKVPSLQENTHPAAGQETNFYLRVAW